MTLSNATSGQRAIDAIQKFGIPSDPTASTDSSTQTRAMIWLLIDPRGKPAEPAYYSRIEALKIASARNAWLARRCESIRGEYWRVRGCAMAETPSGGENN